MRVRSSSAPTVRSRPNQRALSMARAAGSTKPASSSTSRSVKWCGVAVLEGDEPDGGAPGGEHGVEARAGAAGRGPGPPRPSRFVLADRRCGARTARASGAGQVRRGRSAAAAAGPSRRTVCHALVGLVVEEDGRRRRRRTARGAGSTRGVEHLVEVERGRQGLGDLVQLEEQDVGVGQAAQPVEGERSGARRPRRRSAGRSRRPGPRAATSTAHSAEVRSVVAGRTSARAAHGTLTARSDGRRRCGGRSRSPGRSRPR